MPIHHETVLPSGLRVIHEMSSSPVVYCGYVVMAGTRHEDPADAGMAHFIEHMSFKGTERRRACHIANGLERVGGDLNAFTNKQETVYYATVLRPDFARAVDLLTDIVFHSTYPQHEIDREVEVICDEIESYRDAPAELIFDEFEAMLFDGHPLGRDILGEAGRLRSYTTADAHRFAKKFYHPANTVFYVYGDLTFGRIVRCLEKCHSTPVPATGPQICTAAGNTPPPALRPGTTRIVEKGTHQAHVLIGGPAYGGHDRRRFALLLLNNLLGGPGMNSRLNITLREKAGLVYSVDSSLSTYPDTGWWTVYFGCDTHDTDRCLRLIHRELHRLAATPLTTAQLAAAQKQLTGQIGIACDNSESYSLALGKTFAHYGVWRDVEGLCGCLAALTPEEVQAAAAEIYAPERLTTLIYR